MATGQGRRAVPADVTSLICSFFFSCIIHKVTPFIVTSALVHFYTTLIQFSSPTHRQAIKSHTLLTNFVLLTIIILEALHLIGILALQECNLFFTSNFLIGAGVFFRTSHPLNHLTLQPIQYSCFLFELLHTEHLTL